MTIEIRVIRNMLDMPDDAELQDEVIQEFILQATVYINNIVKPGAPSAMIDLATKVLAAYWSYQAYSDRHHHEVIGSFDSQANWVPQLQKAWERDTAAKLAALERKLKMILDPISDLVGTPNVIPVFSSIR